MATVSQTLRTGLAVTLILAGLTTGAQGLVPGGGGVGSFGGESRSTVQIKGKVVCAGCRLDEVRKTQPNEHALYQLTHKRGQIVMQVKEVNDTRWSSLVWPPLLWVRAKDSVFQQLTAEENLMREVELTGLLRSSRTLDIFVVTIGG
jgi:hypothetical protein